MSTTYHDPITVGAAANAATVNAPLGELDAAITAARNAATAGDDALDDRIDNIVGYSGTSTVEVVDARTAGNTGSAAASLTERLEWLEGAQNVYAAAYGFADGNNAGTNFIHLTSAFTAAAAFAAPAVVVLPAGRFLLNNITLPVNVLMRGARMPAYDFAGALQGGTVLEGSEITMSDRSGLMDLGIEVGTGKNSITGGGADDCLIDHVAVLGVVTATEASKSSHGCVFTSGQRNVINIFRPYHFIHGLVLKGSYNTVIGLDAYECTTSPLSLYSNATVDCTHNIILGVRARGTSAANVGSIWVNAGVDSGAAKHVQYNQISGIDLEGPQIGVLLRHEESSGSECRYNVIGPGVITGATQAGVTILEAANTAATATAGCNYNILTGIMCVDCVYSIANNYGGSYNTIVGCQSVNPGTGHVVGAFAQYGINQQSGILARLTKTAQAIASGVASWVDVTWNTESGVWGLWDPDGDNTAEVGGFPFNGGSYRIYAYIQFGPATAGNRYVQVVRDTGGGYSTTPFSITVRPALVNQSQGISIELSSPFNTGYRFKVQVMQDCGAPLNVDTSSYLIVQATR